MFPLSFMEIFILLTGFKEKSNCSATHLASFIAATVTHTSALDWYCTNIKPNNYFSIGESHYFSQLLTNQMPANCFLKHHTEVPII